MALESCPDCGKELPPSTSFESSVGQVCHECGWDSHSDQANYLAILSNLWKMILRRWRKFKTVEKIITLGLLSGFVFFNVVFLSELWSEIFGILLIIAALAFIAYVAFLILQEINNQAKRKAEEQERLAKEYESSKQALKRNPQDSNFREAVLKAGRAYYSALRGKNILTIYDEQAINNDLLAIIGSNSTD